MGFLIFNSKTIALILKLLQCNTWMHILRMLHSRAREMLTVGSSSSLRDSGSTYGLSDKSYHNKQSGLLASSLATDEVDRAIMFAMEEKIAHLSSHLAMTTERERLRDKQLAATTTRERQREK
ncbi:hypothetical protein HAX54_008237 [Datura stramonium]|uniref:Uncharacterized protein n=1 Tax=Datura stramonium TaxID=4076 RepID=A0ABS8TDW1_DATST|nr:hypothetical protein [Datura stramonium]